MRKKRYMRFFAFPLRNEYGMMCTRSWWECFKFGLRHILQGRAVFFIITKSRPKKSKQSQ